MTRRARPTVAMIEAAEEEIRELMDRLNSLAATRDAQEKAREGYVQEIRELRRGHERLQSLVDAYTGEVSGLQRQQEALIASLTLMEASRLKVITELEATRVMLKQTDRLAIAS